MGTDRVKAIGIRVHGRVQGVYYRASALRKANELRLTGSVRNEAGGSVYLEVEGEPPSVQEMLDWCAEGPPLAKVLQVETMDLGVEDRQGFVILQ